MANVTYGTPAPIRHVLGDVVAHFYVVSGASGSTLPVNLPGILFIANQSYTQAGTASLITGISNSGGTITLTSSGPMVTEVIEVITRVG